MESNNFSNLPNWSLINESSIYHQKQAGNYGN